MSADGDLDVRQTITMTTEARRRLRSTAVQYDMNAGPFGRVLMDAALDLLEEDEAFGARLEEAVEAEKALYRKG